MHVLLLATLLKAATVIVSGSVGTPNHPQDLALVGVGTGVVVARLDADHYAIVTAAHVARYANPQVAVYGHPRAHARVDMKITDPRQEDVAMLVVRTNLDLPVIALAARRPDAGARLTVVGHPYARTWSVNYATYAGPVEVSSRLRPLATRDTSVWICRGCDRGNSGSGIYDARGRLTAIVYAAAPLNGYRKADAREQRTDTYNPRIVREVLAIDVREVRSLLRKTRVAWEPRGPNSSRR